MPSCALLRRRCHPARDAAAGRAERLDDKGLSDFAAGLRNLVSRRSGRGNPCPDGVLQLGNRFALRFSERGASGQIDRFGDEALVLVTPEDPGGIPACIDHSSSSYLSTIAISCLAW